MPIQEENQDPMPARRFIEAGVPVPALDGMSDPSPDAIDSIQAAILRAELAKHHRLS